MTLNNCKQILYHFADFDAEALAAHVRSGACVVARGVCWDGSPFPKLARGWEYRSTKPGSTDSATIYIAPYLYETGQIYATGQYNLARKLGLCQRHAMRWARSKHPAKHRYLHYLATLLTNPRYAAAHRAFNYDGTVVEYAAWVRHWQIMDKLQPNDRQELIHFWLQIKPTAMLR